MLEQFLPSIVNFSSELAEIYVADNASTDSSIAYIKEYFPIVQIVENTTNGGYAKGYNDALKSIDADIYCLINSDIEVTQNWISPILEVFKKEKNTAIIQPKILDFKAKDTFEYAGAGGGFIDLYGYPYCRGRVFNHLEQDTKQFNDVAEIFWASGACFFIRSKVYHQLNGFDEDYFAHQEEIDLCWRLQLAGYKIYACPEAIVYHVGAGTLPRGGRKVFLNFRNNLIMLTKNLPLSSLIWKLPARFSLDAISAYKGLLSGDTSFFFAIAKAHFAYMGYVLSGKLKRTESPKALETLEGVYPGSMVYQYFIKNKQYFSKIVAKLAHY